MDFKIKHLLVALIVYFLIYYLLELDKHVT